MDADGDPGWWHLFGPPGPGPLTAHWADDEPTPAALADELGINPATEADRLAAACEDYESAYVHGWCDTVLAAASYHTTDTAAG